jgi:ferrochelatase
VKTGIILLNFGEPAEASLSEVVPFLERIFLTNASLEGDVSPDAVRARSRLLAEQRAPGLIQEYEEIGGSPLNAQAHAQADALASVLRQRGHDVKCYVGMQFAEPLIAEAVTWARIDGIKRLIGLAVYPTCGPSTTVAALEQLKKDVQNASWDVTLHEISGWHRHPAYIALRADAIRAAARQAGLDLNAPRTRLVFSAHGTPMKYVREGSRYVDYTVECCDAVAAAVGARSYALGYQNHTNRPIEWTTPDIDQVLRDIDADTVLIDAISFIHEQSETLAEIDIELREVAEQRGLAFHRVPVPHADPRLAELLADLAEWFIPESAAAARARIEPTQCTCRARAGTCCTNGDTRAIFGL